MHIFMKGRNMRIVITGATGMIGFALARIAKAEGHEVTCLVNPDSSRKGRLKSIQGIDVIECGIEDYDSIQIDKSADVFIHMAWAKTFGSGRDDAETQYSNIGYTLSAIRLARRMNCRMFIGIGSQAEYGPKDTDLTAKLAVNPESGYGISKYAAGRLASLYCKQNEMRFSWVRILSVYGPGDGKNTLISYVINEILSGRQPKLTKCEQIWDYIYCDDAAEAILSIAKSDVDGGVYPLGSGKGRKLSEYVKDVRDVINPEIEPAFGAIPYYPHQPMYLVADITELSEATGWSPKVDFMEGIRRTVEYTKREAY